ncbi:MAG: hypothetical protein AAGA53_01525 [Pseudomonadota bacterium]
MTTRPGFPFLGGSFIRATQIVCPFAFFVDWTARSTAPGRPATTARARLLQASARAGVAVEHIIAKTQAINTRNFIAAVYHERNEPRMNRKLSIFAMNIALSWA